MKITFVRAVGFRGIRDEVNIRFQTGFVVICGRNGAGKSTLCDAIEFALTGGLDKYGLETERGEDFKNYIWWRGKGRVKEPYVSIGLSNDQGGEIVITRTPKGLTSSTGDKIDILLCADSAPKEGLIQLCRTSIIRDEAITKFSLDLSETNRFDFVRNAIGAVEFPAIETKMNEVVNMLTARLNDYTKDYDKIRARISEITATLSELRSLNLESADFVTAEKNLRLRLGREVGDVKDLVTGAHQTLMASRLKIDQVTRLFRALEDLKKRQAEIETQEYLAKVQNSVEEISLLERRLKEATEARAEADNELARQNAEKPRLASMAQLLEHGGQLGLTNGKCPLCGSAVSEEDYQAHTKILRQEIDAQSANLLRIVEEQRKAIELEARINNELTTKKRLLSGLIGVSEHIAQEYADLKRDAVSASVLEGGTAELEEKTLLSLIERNVSMKMRHFQQIFSVPLHCSQATAC